jgi:hypothetical protein
MKKNNFNFKIFKQIFLFSLILPFMFSAVRAENMEDKITENKASEKTVTEKAVDKVSDISSTVKNLFKKDEAEIKLELATGTNKDFDNSTTTSATDTLKIASTTKEILENIKKEVKENKLTKVVKSKKTKKVVRNSCDIFLSILDKSENLDDKINSSLIKIDNLQKQIDQEFQNRASILDNLKNVLSNDVSDKDEDAQSTLQSNLNDAKEFYVDLDDRNKEFITYLENNLCDKVKNTEANDKEDKIDLLVNKEKLYKKTLSVLLKSVVENLQNEIVKSDK